MTDWPREFFIRSASTRPRVSVGPPAGNGTTIVIGRVGNDCARAKRGASEAAALAASQWRSVRRRNFIMRFQLSLRLYQVPIADTADFALRFYASFEGLTCSFLRAAKDW